MQVQTSSTEPSQAGQYGKRSRHHGRKGPSHGPDVCAPRSMHGASIPRGTESGGLVLGRRSGHEGGAYEGLMSL